MSEQFRDKRSAAVAAAGCVLSGLLLALLFHTLPFEAGAYQAALARARWQGLAGIVASTVFHCWITGMKWRYVTRLTSRGADLGWGYYLYSALIGLLGQLLPLQVALVAGRSLALRIHGNIPLRRGAGGAVYDQFFDLLVPMTMIAPIVLAACSVVSHTAGALLSLAAVALAGVIVVLAGERAIETLLWPIYALAPAQGRIAQVARVMKEAAPRLAGRRTLATLYLLSALRFSNLVLRAWLVAWTLHLDLSWMVALFSNCGVTFSLVFAFAPGALGVVEWGWVGMLHLFGIPANEAAVYALSSRLFAVTALLAINLVHAILLVAYWGLRAAHGRASRIS